MLRIAVCDDDAAVLHGARLLIADCFARQNRPFEIESFGDPCELIRQAEGRRTVYDIVLMDLEMPAMHGFDAAQRLRKIDRSFKLIFITSHTEEVYDAFRYDAFAFIPKSDIQGRLEDVLRNAAEMLDDDLLHDTRAFSVHQINCDDGENTTVSVRVRDAELVYFESVQREIILHTQNCTYSAKGEAFGALKEEYRDRGFLETHRTVMVNPVFLKLVHGTDVELTSGERVPLSRRQRDNVLKLLARDVRAAKHESSDTA